MGAQTPGKDQCHLSLTTLPDPSPTSVALDPDKSLGLVSLRALNHRQDSGTCRKLAQLSTRCPFGDVEHNHLCSQHTCATSHGHHPSQGRLPTTADLQESNVPRGGEKPELVVLVQASLAVMKHSDKKNWVGKGLLCLKASTPPSREVRAGTPG